MSARLAYNGNNSADERALSGAHFGCGTDVALPHIFSCGR
jgi:hypothetical protein